MSEFNTKDLANTAWASATVNQSDEKLFTALAKATLQLVRALNVQNLASTAMAFATENHLEAQQPMHHTANQSHRHTEQPYTDPMSLPTTSP